MRNMKFFALFSLLASISFAAEDTILHDIPSLRDACSDLANVGRPFDITGDVLIYYRRPRTYEWVFTLKNGSDSFIFYEYNGTARAAVNIEHPQLGDRIRLRGVLYEYQGGCYPGYTKADFLSHGTHVGTNSVKALPRDLFNPALAKQILQMRGVVRDFFRDEGDSGFIHMALNCQGEIAHAMIFHPADKPIDPARYIGAKVLVSGISVSKRGTLRQHIGHVLMVSGLENIQILKPDRKERTRISDIDELGSSVYLNIASFGLHQVTGTVLAVWNHDHALLHSKGGSTIKVQFLDKTPPRIGQGVRIVGIPETDLYFINLVNATWEPVLLPNNPDIPLQDISPKDILLNDKGQLTT